MRTIRLDKLIKTIESGRRPKGGVSHISEGIPSLGGEHLTDDGRFNFESVKFVPEDFYKKLSAGKICPNDILIVKDGATTGKTSIVTEEFPFKEAAINEHLFIIRADESIINQKFLYWFLFGPFGNRQMMRDFRGATVGGISKKFLQKVEVPVPSNTEQKRIVDIIDQADALRRKREQSLSLLDDLMQSVFLEMFGDPLLNPKDWEVRKLGELVRKVGSGATPRGGSNVYQDQGHVFIRSQNVLMFQFDFSDVAHISDEIHKDMERSWVKDGDVLLNITGASIGRVNYFRGENNQANVNQHVCIIRPKNNLILSEYLTYHLGFDSYQRKIISENAGATRQAFNYRQIKDFDIMVPPIEKQKEFVETIESHKNLRKKFLSSKNKLSELFFSLQHSAFSGQL